MGNVITNLQGTYYAGVTPAGRLMVDALGGGSVSSQMQIWDGTAWQDLHGTDVGGGDFAVDVNIVQGGDFEIGAVELKDHTTDDRAVIALTDGTRSYAAGTDAGLHLAFVDELGTYNYGIVDSTSHSLRTITYGSVAFDNTNNVFLNQIWGWNADDTALQDLNVIIEGEGFNGTERSIAVLGTDGTDWFNLRTDNAGNLKVVVTAGGGGNLYNDQVSVTTAGTAVALAGSVAITRVTIKANVANTGNIYVGNSSVDSSSGLVLEAGESVDVFIDNLDEVWIDADVNAEGISFIAS